MKHLGKVFILFFALFWVTGCNEAENKNVAIKAQVNEVGDILINESDITRTATFLNYEVDEVQIGFIVVRGTDGTVRLAFNTCQSCNPSPNAYFIQKGDYFECQNCGNQFYIDKIGIEKGGCNPALVEEMTQKDGLITIASTYAKTYIENFRNWNGPKA